jgi:hypothetical protein
VNERIKELAREAGLLVHNPNGVPTKLEKFAELIIQDCITQVAMIGISNFEDDDSGDISWTVGKCIEMIQVNFDLKNKNVV